MDVFDLQAKISLDDSAYKAGLASAGTLVKDFATVGIKALTPELERPIKHYLARRKIKIS